MLVNIYFVWLQKCYYYYKLSTNPNIIFKMELEVFQNVSHKLAHVHILI